MSEALFEIQVAAMLGHRKWSEFRRAVRDGRVPPPTRIEGKTKIWSRRHVQAWIDGSGQNEPTSEDLMERLEKV